MIVHVKGRDIEIDDGLANAYESIGQGPVRESFILREIIVETGKDDEDVLPELTDEDIRDITHKAIREYLEVMQ